MKSFSNPTEIRTGYLPKTSVDVYLYPDLCGVSKLVSNFLVRTWNFMWY